MSLVLVESVSIKDHVQYFSPGDNVEVTDGELINLRGKITTIDGERIVIMPDHEDLKV